MSFGSKPIIIDNLLRITNPFYKMPTITKKDVKNAIPIEKFEKPRYISRKWLAGRVAYFMQNMDNIEPIKVSVGGIGQEVYDGKIRLLAYVLAKRKTIKASVCGSTEVIEYLEGTRDRYGRRTPLMTK